ncbi:sigma-54 interaction domain-containing protein [Desulfogranum mediterraneum]|uniref:sigma-54 interaction domain-containing protein n=1 Tax=Desulfogranum mediterraneum TaxID=160661 RepID=UPI00041A80A1|nr:sigma-54-dependent Fis family transcriptional regulator [Desulfogranum mediterraneum]
MKSEQPLPQSLPDVVDLLNAIPHGIALLDNQLCIVAMNRILEAMTGFTAAEAVGIYADYILRTSLSSNDLICRQVLAEGGSNSREGNIINRARLRIPVHCTITRIEKDEQPTGVMVVLEDMSVLQAAKQEGLSSEGRAEIIGHSRQMEAIFEMMAVLARTDASVLITGETGTGKDKIAEQLHHSSQRVRRPFIKVNCGALPEALLESELFGHVKGAFTGALRDSAGKFRLADKGTLFLTEIGDLSLPLQVKLLSVLDDREFFPIGSSQKVKVDVRVIAATHRSLRQEVQRGRFREDLYYRLNVLHLHIPPLREREGDVRLLLEHFIRQFSRALGRNIKEISPEALRVLLDYPYPGNVRELRNIVEYGVNLCHGEQIQLDDLPRYMFKPVEPLRQEPGAEGFAQPGSSLRESAPMPPLSAWEEMERSEILNALRRSGGSKKEAARLLGWGRTTLWRKIKKYGLNKT